MKIPLSGLISREGCNLGLLGLLIEPVLSTMSRKTHLRAGELAQRVSHLPCTSTQVLSQASHNIFDDGVKYKVNNLVAFFH